MSTVDTLRKHCSSLCAEREKNLQSTLSEYFESAFIGKHKPFRAIIGNKRCKPIPIYRDFAFSIQESYGFKLVWPNFSEETLRKELSNLGFIITENKISISVPSHSPSLLPSLSSWGRGCLLEGHQLDAPEGSLCPASPLQIQRQDDNWDLALGSLSPGQQDS